MPILIRSHKQPLIGDWPTPRQYVAPQKEVLKVQIRILRSEIAHSSEKEAAEISEGEVCWRQILFSVTFGHFISEYTARPPCWWYGRPLLRRGACHWLIYDLSELLKKQRGGCIHRPTNKGINLTCRMSAFSYSCSTFFINFVQWILLEVTVKVLYRRVRWSSIDNLQWVQHWTSEQRCQQSQPLVMPLRVFVPFLLVRSTNQHRNGSLGDSLVASIYRGSNTWFIISHTPESASGKIKGSLALDC